MELIWIVRTSSAKKQGNVALVFGGERHILEYSYENSQNPSHIFGSDLAKKLFGDAKKDKSTKVIYIDNGLPAEWTDLFLEFLSWEGNALINSLVTCQYVKFTFDSNNYSTLNYLVSPKTRNKNTLLNLFPDKDYPGGRSEARKLAKEFTTGSKPK